MKKPRTRVEAANACIDILDAEFCRALSEPARIRIFRELVLLGRSDIGTIAQALPQDRSVIARHLQMMERAGLLHSQTEGRHTYYQIDGPAIAARVDDLAKLIRALVPLCCGDTR